MGIVFKNNAKTTLSSAVNNSTTTIPVTEGSVFPAVNLSGAGTFFLLTLDDETNNEILKVTSCSGASGNINLTVIRAQEGTTARAFDSGDKAELRFTSGTVDEIRSDNTVHTNIFTTANNSTTDFTLSDEVANENDLVVFIDGVFQAHNTFSVSGTTLTLATAPASGRVVTVYSIKGSRSASNVALATMTGDNSDTTLTLPVEPINENSVQVFFDGVYQNKDSFSISGTTLTFGVAPPTGVAVEALVFTKLAINTSSILSDTDADTKVQVEESSDEDKIRFDTGGSERMIIDSSGNLFLGTTSGLGKFNMDFSSVFGKVFKYTGSTSTIFPIVFDYGSSTAGSISITSSATSYNTSSDYRLKENVNYEFDALSRVAQLKPARFNFIADADTTIDGFLAHEVSDIVPEAITGEKDGEEMQGIDQSKLVPLLTKAIQELSAKVKELEGKIE